MTTIVSFLSNLAHVANGNLLLAIVFVVGWASVVIGWYTRKGSGIYNHAYGKRYSNAPGARIDCGGASGRDSQADMNTWSRGTR